MLLLVGMTLFTDKSNNMVDFSYLQLFLDLQVVRTYAWGAASLAFMHDNLGDANRTTMSNLAGYITLFQVSQFILSFHLLFSTFFFYLSSFSIIIIVTFQA